MKSRYSFAITGIITGVLSFVSLYLATWIFEDFLRFDVRFDIMGRPILMMLAIGFLFGGGLGTNLFRHYRVSFIKILIFTIVSGVAYLCAESLAVHVGIATETMQPALLFGGTVGTFILSLGFHFIFTRLTIRQFMVVISIGGILGEVYHLAGSIDSSLEALGLVYFSELVLYTVWQCGVAFIYGLFMEKNPLIAPHGVT